MTFTAGVNGTTQGGGKTCDYGDGTANVFHVIVAVAADEATAKAGKAEAEAEILKAATKGVKFTEVPSLGDGAAYIAGHATYLGATVNASALYGLKGLTFYGFSDLALTPTMTPDQLQMEAMAILSQLP